MRILKLLLLLLELLLSHLSWLSLCNLSSAVLGKIMMLNAIFIALTHHFIHA